MKSVYLEAPQQEKLLQWEAHASQQRVAPAHCKWKKAHEQWRPSPAKNNVNKLKKKPQAFSDIE